ncbi:helix-turn-helix transcriptional regulator [Agrobacterium sp. BA1120]|uniref:helix-turn-helix transcriptional regulator n=1 Tax=Agrobacterium sp. BA1120 TaxID=3228927 RepID=UPI003369DAF8
MQTADIIDGIYEAALVPEKWQSVLVNINDIVGTRGGVIFTQSEVGATFVATPAAVEIFQRFASEGWDKHNTRRERADRLDHAGFVTDLDVFNAHELADEPLYRDFLYPLGLGWSVGTHITTPDGDRIAASFDGDFEAGPISREKTDWLDSIRPHLARSLSIAGRLKMAAASKVVDGLGVFGLPACVVSPGGRMLAANTLMQLFIPSLIMDSRERVKLRHAQSDRLMQKALAQLAINPSVAKVMSIPVPAFGEGAASVVHIVPVRGQGQDIMPGGLFILVISTLASSTVPGTSLLRGLFDLTASEAKVARLAASGTAPKDISIIAGISPNTVKTHLKSIYAKTGTEYHGALVRLLSGTLMPLPFDATHQEN